MLTGERTEETLEEKTESAKEFITVLKRYDLGEQGTRRLSDIMLGMTLMRTANLRGGLEI